MDELKLETDMNGTVTREQILDAINELLSDEEKPLKREFHHVGEKMSASSTIRVMQWNQLAQALCGGRDNFIRCKPRVLNYQSRKWKIIREILTYDPDIVALQEVDNYSFLEEVLGIVGYKGTFQPKPDSPCLYVNGNRGPDGCALFYKTDKYNLIQRSAINLCPQDEIANQVLLCYKLQLKNETKSEFVVMATHLKAKSGFDELRLSEGQHISRYISENFKNLPVILCGDFNAPPTEDVYKFIIDSDINVDSAYRMISSDKSEPGYTTWKIRGDKTGEKESCRTIDYIFYSKHGFIVKSLLKMASGHDIGPDRLPSMAYPSDHFSLVADFALI